MIYLFNDQRDLTFFPKGKTEKMTQKERKILEILKDTLRREKFELMSV